mmetsp:Transcript_13449/g.18405  ORF Transcript_13449/g.18405 Transcript_13449/m.18405 type:complete len:120 (+) Transcript_13449:74-433(+)
MLGYKQNKNYAPSPHGTSDSNVHNNPLSLATRIAQNIAKNTTIKSMTSRMCRFAMNPDFSTFDEDFACAAFETEGLEYGLSFPRKSEMDLYPFLFMMSLSSEEMRSKHTAPSVQCLVPT